MPRPNPYPVVTPIANARAGALTIAYTYPAPTSSSCQSVGTDTGAGVNHRGDALRVCIRFGCGTRLPAHVLGDMCEVCTGAGFVCPPPAPIQRHVLPSPATQRTCPRPRGSTAAVSTVSHYP